MSNCIRIVEDSFWNVVLALLAAADCCAALAQRWSSSVSTSSVHIHSISKAQALLLGPSLIWFLFDEDYERIHAHASSPTFIVKVNNDHLTVQNICSHNTIGVFICWLCAHADILGHLFAWAWFVDAFVDASSQRLRAARKHDKAQLLRQQQEQQNDEQTCHDAEYKNNLTSPNRDEALHKWWRGFHGVYFRTIIFQISLLPVGFFVFWTTIVQCILNGNVDRATFWPALSEESLAKASGTSSLFFAVLQLAITAMARRTNNLVRYQALIKKKELTYKVLYLALRHPFRFHRRLRRFFSAVRWIQYLAPLFATFTKLKANLGNLLSRWHQRREAIRTESVRQRLRRGEECSVYEIRDFCARLIQNKFRRHLAREEFRIINLWKGKKETVAAFKFQSAFLASLSRARMRLDERWQLLHSLQEKDKEYRRSITEVKMSVQERRRMYVLQTELEKQTQSWINEQLLLHPNTSFAVIWKIVFVVAVLIEISTLAFQPILAHHKDNATGLPLSLKAYLDQQLIPVPVFKLSVCTGLVQTPLRTREWPSILSFAKLTTSYVTRLSRSKPVTAPRPWYCNGVYSRLQAVYIILANLAVHHLFVIFSIVCFVDVYIDFITGEFDGRTGRLVPPPFFARWIFPGLLFQLLINPEMDSVCTFLTRSFVEMMYFGPVRVLRWTVALFYPLVLAIQSLRRYVRLKYACEQNLTQPAQRC